MSGFSFSEQVRALGVEGFYFSMTGMTNQQTQNEFDLLWNEELAKLRVDLTAESIESNSILVGFRELKSNIGRSPKRFVAASENLLALLLKNGTLPRINLIVDIYNYISIQTTLAVGAHDLEKVSGDIRLDMTNGTEGFWPLGAKEPTGVSAGEYAYIDAGNDILCRMEVRQVEKTKVTLSSTDCFFVVQGNKNTSGEYIQKGGLELISLLKQFCGGEEEILYSPS
jgi:DNA/RNA-binding domain of Phe-tRNA-synthetase-like protein